MGCDGGDLHPTGVTHCEGIVAAKTWCRVSFCRTNCPPNPALPRSKTHTASTLYTMNSLESLRSCPGRRLDLGVPEPESVLVLVELLLIVEDAAGGGEGGTAELLELDLAREEEDDDDDDDLAGEVEVDGPLKRVGRGFPSVWYCVTVVYTTPPSPCWRESSVDAAQVGEKVEVEVVVTRATACRSTKTRGDASTSNKTGMMRRRQYRPAHRGSVDLCWSFPMLCLV